MDGLLEKAKCFTDLYESGIITRLEYYNELNNIRKSFSLENLPSFPILDRKDLKLDVVLRHYDALPILIQHVKKSIGGAEVLSRWDVARARPIDEKADRKVLINKKGVFKMNTLDKKVFLETMKHYDIAMVGTVGFLDDEQVEHFLGLVQDAVIEKTDPDFHKDIESVEDYIRQLEWEAGTPDTQKTLVAGNIRAFYHWSRHFSNNVLPAFGTGFTPEQVASIRRIARDAVSGGSE